MISTATRAVDVSPHKQSDTATSPNLKFPIPSGIVAKYVVPIPPSTSPTHQSLSNQKVIKKSISARSLSTASQKKHENKFKEFSLEIRPEELVWLGWKPGKEYVRNLVLKNVKFKTLKFKFRVPTSRFFRTAFPQPIALSAGTSFTLPITFRPLEKTKYEDRIEFVTEKGSFSVALRGLLPEHDMRVPDRTDFGMVTVDEPNEITFELHNLSQELATPYSWEVASPFSVQPRTGTLLPGAYCLAKVTFRASQALIYRANAVCKFGDGKATSMQLSGTGKFPHIALEIAEADRCRGENDDDALSNSMKFGDVGVHETREKFITLVNTSPVRAQFQIARTLEQVQIDQAFTCPVTSGFIDGFKKTKIPILYTPHNVDRISTDYFQVTVAGIASKSVFKCVGNCTGPCVKLSLDLLNFGTASADDTVIRTLEIRNDSDCAAIFQVLLDADCGVFRVDRTSGSVPPREVVMLTFSFRPTHPINYYRKATVLAHDANPLTVEMIGTCHGEQIKPAILHPRHVTRYRVHSARGLTFYPPDVLRDQLAEGKLVKDENGCLALVDQPQEAQTPLNQPAMEEYFNDGHSTVVTNDPPHVSLDAMSLWLGGCDDKAAHRTVRISNHTRGRITAVWMTDPSGVFQILPAMCDIAPLKNAEFRVVFQPNVPNQFFGHQLECFVAYRCMRDYRLVDDTTLCLPWLLTLDVTGHSFSGNNQTFRPHTTLSTKKLVFPTVAPGKNSYQTLLMERKGDTPTLYQFTAEDSRFTVKPTQGMIKSRYQIVTIRLAPPPDTNVQIHTSLKLRLNVDHKNDKTVTLLGSGDRPEMLLNNGGELYFRPTCVRNANRGRYEVRNVGRSPLKFRWALAHDSRQCLSVSPAEGLIQPNESQSHEWTFTPDRAEKLVFKATLLTWLAHRVAAAAEADYVSADARKFKLRVIGEGDVGEIRARQTSIDFGCVVAGSTRTRPIEIVNDSPVDLRYRLTIEQFINNDYGEEASEREPLGLHLSEWEGTMSARSSRNVTIRATPHRRLVYTWSIYYEILDVEGNNVQPNSRILLSEVSAEGVYPTLAVTDARSTGSGANISKTQLWRWFSLDHLNSCLDSDPEKSELAYSVSTRCSTSRRPSVYTKSIMGFNFGAAPINHPPCDVVMVVKNTGAVSVHWAFLFPKDIQLDVDQWAETSDFESDELHDLHVQDNKLFEVNPTRGNLRPGESKTVKLTYKHDVSGTHRLPVVLKVDQGKEILLNFVGVTVEPDRRYLHFAGTRHTFTPMPIGAACPLKQLYEIYNGGSTAVVYEVGLDAVDELRRANYDRAVFTCLNPRGEVLPGSAANLEWIFTPLESKTYTVDVPIHMLGGESALITFIGIGYDGRKLGKSMQMLDQPPEFTAVPVAQQVALPGQMLFLSEERISFGNVPLFGRARHVVFLRNQSTDRSITYSWHASSEVVNQVLTVEPARGQLNPGQSATTRVTLCAAGQPSFYDLDLVCEVEDDTATARYRDELEAWERERERQRVEFVITETNADAADDSDDDESVKGSGLPKASSSMRVLENVLNRPPSPAKLVQVSSKTKVVRSKRKTFATLPPIRYENPPTTPSNRSRSVRRMEKAGDDEWPRPQPPRPFLSHLGVTARTHDITEYRTHFASDSKKHFIDQTLQVGENVQRGSPLNVISSIGCSQEEKTTILSVMTNLLRNLLDDPTVIESLESINDDLTPYFNQFRQSNREGTTEEADDTTSHKPETDPAAAASMEEEVDIRDTSAASSQLMDEILKQEQMASEAENNADELNSEEIVIESATGNDVRPRANSEIHAALLKNEIIGLPEFSGLLEEVLATTIGNVMEEAARGEVLLTARPRVVALPPPSSATVEQRNRSAKSRSSTESVLDRTRRKQKKSNSRK